jgi:hypothetical protein
VFCGPAVAQMILAPITGKLVPQGTLKKAMQDSSIHERCTLTGGTGAVALAFGLNSHKPNGFATYFDTSATDAMSKITQTLQSGIAAAALIYGGKHWVVVTAMTADPGGSVFFNNPLPITPNRCFKGLPPTHTTADGCGSGGSAPCDRGGFDQAVSSDWLKTFFSTCTLCAEPFPQPLSIAVGVAGLTESSGARGVRSVKSSRIVSELRGTADPAEIQAAARGGIERYQLARGRTEIQADRPWLVQRIDRKNEFFYLAPIRYRGDWTVVARIDAQQPLEYAGAHVRPRGGYRILEPTEVLGRLKGSVEFERDPGAFTVAPVLVWLPSRESPSPSYALHRIDRHGTFFRFVGNDGAVHAELHDLLTGEPIRL